MPKSVKKATLEATVTKSRFARTPSKPDKKEPHIDAPGTRTLNLSLISNLFTRIGGLRATIAPAHRIVDGLQDKVLGITKLDAVL
ncbi:hypothetical protein HJFPF1_04889 [Paramyrothecium foliicola]|nr:hypothetical protein HJFPF1_04889 [Paramyrothecium foliicola]